MNLPEQENEDKDKSTSRNGESRRAFLKKTSFAMMAVAGGDLFVLSANSLVNKNTVEGDIPWYRRITRWGQTNITEIDPANYDISWWRNYWRTTKVQGIIVNAGGIVAYYPSKVPLHRPAQYLGGSDLFG